MPAEAKQSSRLSRMGIDGRSTMPKAELENAVDRH
jgi:hypothetical protein